MHSDFNGSKISLKIIETMALTWDNVLKEQLGQNQDLKNSTIISCGDLSLPLPALIAQSLDDPHDSTFFDSFAVQHGKKRKIYYLLCYFMHRVSRIN